MDIVSELQHIKDRLTRFRQEYRRAVRISEQNAIIKRFRQEFDMSPARAVDVLLGF